MTVSNQTVAALVTGGILSIIIPIIAVVIYKKKNKDVHISSFFVGCGTFILFALVLESLLHLVMLPVVTDSTVLYVIYGALAAGVFEETGRFAAYKTVMKKRTDPKESVMYGLGHGGIEAIILVGVNYLSFAALAVLINSAGLDSVIALTTGGDPEIAEVARAQIEGFMSMTFGTVIVGVFERIVAMAFHTASSVIVFESAKVKGKTYLYPVCILIHALIDVPAALYQRGVMPLYAAYPFLIAGTAAAVYFAVRSFKRVKAQNE